MNVNGFYNSGFVTRLLDMDVEKLRRWVWKLRRFLSAEANPDVGKIRYYSEQDVNVLAVCHRMREEGYAFADIMAFLETGDLPTLIITAAQHEAQQEELIMLQVKVDYLEGEVEALEGMLDEAGYDE